MKSQLQIYNLWREAGTWQLYFSYGLVLGISIIIGLIFTVIGLFLGHIILFDSIFLAAISGIVCNQIWKRTPGTLRSDSDSFVQPAVLAAKHKARLLDNRRAAVPVLVGGVRFFGYVFSGEDHIWVYVVMGLSFILMMGLHIKGRNN